MSGRKSDLVRDKLAESRRLRKEMSEAGDEFVADLGDASQDRPGRRRTSSRSQEYEAAAARVLNVASEQEGAPVLSQIAGAAVYALLAVAAAIRETNQTKGPTDV